MQEYAQIKGAAEARRCGGRIAGRLSLLLALYSCGATAAVTCEQLFDIATTSEKLRDQGYPLEAVVAEADKPDMNSKFSAAEIVRIKTVIEMAFKADESPTEILRACKEIPRK